MFYSYDKEKLHPFSKMYKITGKNMSLTGIVFEPTFDGVYLRLLADTPFHVVKTQNKLQIGDKFYYLKEDGNFSSSKCDWASFSSIFPY